MMLHSTDHARNRPRPTDFFFWLGLGFTVTYLALQVIFTSGCTIDSIRLGRPEPPWGWRERVVGEPGDENRPVID